MRDRLLNGLLLLFFTAFPAFAQTPTLVSGTITDPNGLPYSYASVSAQLQPTTASPTIIVNGIPVQIGGQVNGAADVNGSFTMNLFCNSAGGGCSVISPSGTTWLITVTEVGVPPPFGYGPQTCTYTATITGATQSLTSALSSACPAMTHPIGGGGGGGSPGAPNLSFQFNNGGNFGGSQFLYNSASGSLCESSIPTNCAAMYATVDSGINLLSADGSTQSYFYAQSDNTTGSPPGAFVQFSQTTKTAADFGFVGIELAGGTTTGLGCFSFYNSAGSPTCAAGFVAEVGDNSTSATNGQDAVGFLAALQMNKNTGNMHSLAGVLVLTPVKCNSLNCTATTPTETATNVWGMEIQDLQGLGSNTAGIHIEAQTNAGANHYGIKVESGGGPVLFQDIYTPLHVFITSATGLPATYSPLYVSQNVSTAAAAYFNNTSASGTGVLIQNATDTLSALYIHNAASVTTFFVLGNGNLTAANVTDSALTSGGCVQASTAGLLATPGGGCLSNPMIAIGDMIGGGASGAPTRIVAGLTGQVIVATNGSTPAFASPGLADGNGGTPIAAASYTIQCDSSTALIDRMSVLRFQSGASAITVPLSTATGCTGHFAVGVIDDGAGTITFNRSGSDTFSIFNGSTASDGQTSFTLTNGQFATLNQGATGLWEVRITTGGGGGSGISGLTAGQFAVAGSATTITSSVAGSGTGSVCLTTNCSMTTPTLNAPAISGAMTGTGAYIPVSLLNSGASASSSTFWRGDGVWAAPPAATSLAMSGLTAATGTNSINNGNFNQTWQCVLTGSTNCFDLGENSASTGTGSILNLFTLVTSTASPLSVSVPSSGSQPGTFGNAVGISLSNPTAASASNDLNSPQEKICGTFWNGTASGADCWTIQVTYANATVTNPQSRLTFTHSGSSGSSFLNTASTWIAQAYQSGSSGYIGSANTTNVVFNGGQDTNVGTTATTLGTSTFRGSDITAGSGTTAEIAGDVILRGGNSNSSSTGATSRAGNLTIEPGALTGISSANDAQGKLVINNVGYTTGTFTVGKLTCVTASNTYADCPTAAANAAFIGVGQASATNQAYVQTVGEATLFAVSATFTHGHYACADTTTTAGAVVDSATPCTAGTGVGIVKTDATTTAPVVLLRFF